MNLERNQGLQEFCNSLERTKVICPQCADTLRKSVYLSTVDTSNPNTNGRIELHIRCTSRLLEFFRDFSEDTEIALSRIIDL